VHVVVAGIGVSGFAAADGLLHFGARVTILDELVDDLTSDRGKLLEVLGGSVRLGPGSTANLPDDADLVIVTGWPASSPLLVQLTFSAGIIVIAEASLSFLGLGTQIPQSSWGTMLRDAFDSIYDSPWFMIAPTVMVVLTILSFATFGDGLRDALEGRGVQRVSKKPPAPRT